MTGPANAVDEFSGMHVTTAPEPKRGRAHARLRCDIAALGALDPERATAVERLEHQLGAELARTLLSALGGGGGSRCGCEAAA